jgi:hypothetical protein
MKITGLKPFPENSLVRRDVGHQPVMTDVVEASGDISLQNPTGGERPRELDKTLLDRIGGGPAGTEPV